MNFDSFRKFCLSLPHVTEDLQWGDDLLFRIVGKIFASYNLNPASGHRVAFKCTPERAAELLEIEGAERAPYVGRYGWISLRALDVLSSAELKQSLQSSYEMIAAKAPKSELRAKLRAEKRVILSDAARLTRSLLLV